MSPWPAMDLIRDYNSSPWNLGTSYSSPSTPTPSADTSTPIEHCTGCAYGIIGRACIRMSRKCAPHAQVAPCPIPPRRNRASLFITSQLKRLSSFCTLMHIWQARIWVLKVPSYTLLLVAVCALSALWSLSLVPMQQLLLPQL